MTLVEGILLWLGVFSYTLAVGLLLWALVFGREKGHALSRHLVTGGFVLQTAAIAVRWYHTGHAPVMGTYEHTLLGSWFIMLLQFMVYRWYPPMRIAAMVVLPFVLFMLGQGIMSKPEMVPLSPPYQSNWLWVHVIFAWIAYGSYTVAAGMGVVYLLRDKKTKLASWQAGRLASFLDKFPPQDIIDDLILKTVVFGFIAHVLMTGAGAIWAHGLWGRYWGWDPVETWSLLSWLIYGVFLHLRTTMGWKGKRAAWLAIICYISIFITFGGVGFISGLHTPLL